MITGEMLARQLRRMFEKPVFLRLYSTGEKGKFVEVAGGGYAPKEYALRDWIMLDTSPAVATGNVSEFRFDGSKRISIAGAYITEPDGGVVWAKEFPEPIVVQRRGDIVPVRPTIKLAPIS